MKHIEHLILNAVLCGLEDTFKKMILCSIGSSVMNAILV